MFSSPFIEPGFCCIIGPLPLGFDEVLAAYSSGVKIFYFFPEDFFISTGKIYILIKKSFLVKIAYVQASDRGVDIWK